MRRAKSLRIQRSHGGSRILDSRRDVATPSSFSAAGSTLESPTLPAIPNFNPPAAARHPLFSHHAAPPMSADASSSFLSDPGPSDPPSPTGSVSSAAFSPASAFLSHFSSFNSLRPVPVAPDAAGARVLDYTLGKTVGRGGFSTVRFASHILTGETFACKIVKRDDLSDRSGSLEKFEEEVRIWLSLPRHPSMLPLIEMQRTPFATYLISPYLPGGSLLDVLKRESGSDRTARKWFPGVVTAVAAMHEGFEGFQGGMLHGDLKLENFLVDHTGRVMVCDFYMARKINEIIPSIPAPIGKHLTLPTHLHRAPRKSSPFPTRHTNEPIPLPTPPFPSASLPYAPPELLRASPSGPSLAQDIWALGIILYALLTGKLPFVDSFDPRLQMKILRGTWDEPHHLGKEWLDCLYGCLDGNRESRWDIRMVRECDAVIGWREVKARSKSRSRSRARRQPSNSPVYERRRRPDGAIHAQPVPITPRRPPSREIPVRQATFPTDPAAVDKFGPPSPRSVSGSRSRSSGRGGHGMFDFSPDLRRLDESITALEAVSITRGRTAKKAEVNGLGFQRGYHVTYQASGSRSTSASRIPPIVPLSRLSPSPSTSPSRSRSSRVSTSPTVLKSRSRSRASPVWEDGRYEFGYGGELESVDEEGRRRDDGGSRGRGRPGGPGGSQVVR